MSNINICQKKQFAVTKVCLKKKLKSVLLNATEQPSLTKLQN